VFLRNTVEGEAEIVVALSVASYAQYLTVIVDSKQQLTSFRVQECTSVAAEETSKGAMRTLGRFEFVKLRFKYRQGRAVVEAIPSPIFQNRLCLHWDGRRGG